MLVAQEEHDLPLAALILRLQANLQFRLQTNVGSFGSFLAWLGAQKVACRNTAQPTTMHSTGTSDVRRRKGALST